MLALVLSEAGVRLFDVPPRPLPPLAVGDYRLSDDPVRVYEYVPTRDSREDHFNDSHAGFQTNSAGFRDREHAQKKPAGVARVLVLGDSTTAGHGVPDAEKLYTSRLERLLNADGASRFEVFNMGVGGYHTLQEVETLRVEGLKYEPDVVIVLVCLNDFDLRSDGGVEEALRKKNVDAYHSPGRGVSSWLVRNSRLAFIVRHLLGVSPTATEDWYRRDVLQGRTPVRAGLELLRELRHEYGFAAVVAILPVFRNPIRRYKYAEVHRRVFEAADGLGGVSVVDLLPRFAELPDDLRAYSIDGLHLNERGHDALARMLVPIVKAAATSNGGVVGGGAGR